MKKILLVEDNNTIIMGLKYLFEKENFILDTSKNVEDALKNIRENYYDLCLIDISLPDGDGRDICKKIKEIEDTAVIFLTAKDDEKDIVKGLDMGADDYITKPFRNMELISRINSVLRRYEKSTKEKNQNIIKVKDVEINLDSAKVYLKNEEVSFTSLEYKILVMLFKNLGKLISREKILDNIWDIAGNFVNDNTLTVYIKRIREKLKDEDGKIIKTVRGLRLYCRGK